jgi:hypothetical protein
VNSPAPMLDKQLPRSIVRCDESPRAPFVALDD